MHLNRNTLAISIGSLVASGLLLLALPTGTTEATWWKPPMPCVAVRAGLFPVGAGFCPGTSGGLDWNKITRLLEAQPARSRCAAATSEIYPDNGDTTLAPASRPASAGHQALGRTTDTSHQGGRS